MFEDIAGALIDAVADWWDSWRRRRRIRKSFEQENDD